MFERRRHRYVYRDVDRYGTVRLYFKRGKGHRKVLMPTDPRSEEFAARYRELCGDAGGSPPGAPERAGNWHLGLDR